MFPLNRRTLVAAAAASLLTGLAHAQADKAPIRILVGFAPGAGTDAVARLMADRLQGVLGQTVIVENMAGAGGRLAANALVAAPADGSTFMIANNAVHVFQTLVTPHQIKWHYQKDFAPVAGLTSYPLAMAVAANLNIKNVQEYVQWVKANEAGALFGSTGMGGQTHFLGYKFGKDAGVPLQVVPYKGVTPMLTDVIAGHTPAAIGLTDDMLKFHNTGKLRIIGVFTEKRFPLTPDIPTFAEQGYGNLKGEAWQGMWAPAKTPRPVLDRMQEAVRKVLEMPDVKEFMTTRLNVVPTFRTGAEVARIQAEEVKYWEPIVKASGFKPE
jgi:tripartite-type tricarboxylate transporter receptor subunit TctC